MEVRLPSSVILIRVNFVELWLSLMVFVRFMYTIK